MAMTSSDSVVADMVPQLIKAASHVLNTAAETECVSMPRSIQASIKLATSGRFFFGPSGCSNSHIHYLLFSNSNKKLAESKRRVDILRLRQKVLLIQHGFLKANIGCSM